MLRLAGLEKGLKMPSNGYNTALWIFYIPFVLAEVPSNMIMSLPDIKPNLWLGGQCFILGILAMCQGLTHSYGGLLGIRFLMGIVETGLPAGAGLLIASYYRKKELSLRFALFFAFGESGSCFSGLLAYTLQGLDGKGGLSGWRWIFVVEGLLTIFFSIFVFIFVPNFPARDKWLKEEDKSRLLARLDADKGEEKVSSEVSWMKMIFDYKIWSGRSSSSAPTSAGSMSSFNPTIVSQLGWTSRRAQVMTIPIWIVGIVGALASSLMSGKLNKRWPFILPAIVVSVIGWTIHYNQVQPPAVRYFAQFLISFGTFVAMPLYIGLLTANLRGRAHQSLGTALQLGLGNCANFISSNIFISKQARDIQLALALG
ncbi:MFS general substrate transporter [Stipitochalara longipes BDJ]|nr:MFS general substrate transporter [Stipitochalara longipes BDJ]